MSIVLRLIIVGWIVTPAMIGCYALSESGRVNAIRKRIALWLEASAAPTVGTSEESL